MLNAVSAPKPPIPSGQIAASVPPATITSASPHWIARTASPMECVPVAQAVTTLIHFPFSPKWIATFPAAIFEIISGIISGGMRPGPFASSFSYDFSIIGILPIPQPTETPIRVRSSISSASPDCAIASALAATAYWPNSSIRFASLNSIVSSGSKSFTCAASFVLYFSVSKRSIRPIPTVFFFRFSQNVSVVFPIGEITPVPVTTTRFISSFPSIPFLHASTLSQSRYSTFIQIPMPPSTESTCPVIYRACSDARKATASAISSGLPIDPSGT